jgi:fido (protein-threonine AMPylation protein)
MKFLALLILSNYIKDIKLPSTPLSINEFIIISLLRMNDKTQPTYKETKFGVLEIQEIEQIIFDNLILVQAYLYKNYNTIDFSVAQLCHIHDLLVSSVFIGWGLYRTHNVQMGNFEAISYTKVPVEMLELDRQIQHRLQFLTNITEKYEFLARVMRKILWIHPFFDYNARVTRLFGELFLLKYWLPVTSFRWATRWQFAEAMKTMTHTWDLSWVISLASNS